ncbi:MAG: trigger factor [Phycisphaerales bacterium]|jgi:trigger factor|nr:trigger factor [Phycisphaerales bacterium]
MSDETATTEGFDFTIEDAGPARKRLHITVSAEAVKEKIDASIGTLQNQSSLPGFRKGRAPMQLLERRFGEALREEARNELMQEGCQNAFEQLGVRPLGDLEPVDPDATVEIVSGKPLEFGVEFEVVPDFDLPDFSAITISRPQLDVTDEHIDDELERQCMRMGSAEELKDSFAPADRLLGSAELFIEDAEEAAFSHGQVLVVLPEKGEAGQVLGLKVEKLGDFFKKAKLGDTIEIKTTGPETHEREDIQGKPLRIAFTIHIAERITPCTPEDLLEQFSLASEDVLREQVRLALEQQRDEDQGTAMREQMLKAVTAEVEMELPEKASGRQISTDLERIQMELMSKGMPAEEVEEKLAEVRDRSAAQTVNRLKTWFILQRIANDQEIAVSEQEINARIATIAMRQGMRPDKLRADMVKNDRIMQLAGSIRERKAADHMVEQATIEDVTMDAWNEQVKAEEAASGS